MIYFLVWATIEAIHKENEMCCIVGDYNINLLNHQSHHPAGDFINTFKSNGFYPLIDKPTTITSPTATLIDNVVTNVHSHVLSAAI